MEILVTGASGYVGSTLMPHLKTDGHRVRGLIRPRTIPFAGNNQANGKRPPLDSMAARKRLDSGSHTFYQKVEPPDVSIIGDAYTGEGLDQALEGVDVAYYLLHSMETTVPTEFALHEQISAENFAAACLHANVKRVIYLGGLLPQTGQTSPHLASRKNVEDILMAAAPESVSFRTSIIVAGRSRSFRMLVQLIDRLPILVLPEWEKNTTQPIDGRDVMEFLRVAATMSEELCQRSWDIAGPDQVTYRQFIDRISQAQAIHRPLLKTKLSLTPLIAELAAVISDEDIGLTRPLMESLAHDLLPRPEYSGDIFNIQLHTLAEAIENALFELESEQSIEEQTRSILE